MFENSNTKLPEGNKYETVLLTGSFATFFNRVITQFGKQTLQNGTPKFKIKMKKYIIINSINIILRSFRPKLTDCMYSVSSFIYYIHFIINVL